MISKMITRPSFKFLIVAIAASCLLGGCSSVNVNAQNPLRRVLIEAHGNANNDLATAVDIVLIYDAYILPVLPKSAPEWFDKKTSLLAGFSQKIEVISVQIPPASASVLVQLPKNISKAVSVVSYANYIASEGQLRGHLDTHTCTRIILEAFRISYAECSF